MACNARVLIKGLPARAQHIDPPRIEIKCSV